MLQIFFLNLYFTATTLKFHTYSFLGYKVNDSLRFLFSYGFFSWFFFSQNFVQAISQILLAHYILSHFAQMIGRDQNFLDVLCCHFQYRFILLIFETFYDPLCAAVNWKTIIYESFFRRGWRCAPCGYLTKVAQFVDLAMAQKLSVNFKSKSSYLFIGIFLSIDNLSKHI